MEQVEPMIKKVDDAIAQYPSLTQYGMSFHFISGIDRFNSRLGN